MNVLTKFVHQSVIKHFFFSTFLVCYALFFGSFSLATDKNSTTEQELNGLLGEFDSSPTEIKQDDALDDIIQGFDDKPKTASDQNIDDILQGFEESGVENSGSTDLIIAVNPIGVEPIDEKNWELTTLLSISSSYSYQYIKPAGNNNDYRGLSRLRLKLQPELRYKLNDDWNTFASINTFYDAMYAIEGRSNFTSETLDSLETDLEIKELYLQGTVSDSLDVKIGRQIVVWGKSDSLRVVDVLNPLDFREPGMVDIEDLRLPVAMLKTDYYFGHWNLTAIAIPEIRFNKIPAFGSEFFLGGNRKPLPESTPDDGKNWEYALALSGNFSGWDASLHYANFYDDLPHITSVPAMSTEHSRLNMLGAAGNIAIGSWLFKSEFAYIDGLEFALSNKKFSRADLMTGIDYTGILDTTLSIEVVDRYLFKYKSQLSQSPDRTKQNEGQISFRYTGKFLREKLQAVVLVSLFGISKDDGGFYRASLKYELDDAMSITAGAVVYQSGQQFLLQQIADNDRVFLDYRYSF